VKVASGAATRVTPKRADAVPAKRKSAKRATPAKRKPRQAAGVGARRP
jgi:hypothetical protein